MGVKISDLPASVGAARTMEFEVNNGNVSERLTLAQMFALSTGAVTASTPLLNLAQTWNHPAVAFTGWKLNVTDTASAAGSLLVDLQVGGATVFSVSKSGGLAVAGPVLSDPSGNPWCRFGASRFSIPVELGLGAVGDVSAPDAFLARDAANTLAQRNGASAQEFRFYNTYTDASNYERGALKTAAGQVIVAAETAGTGTDDMDVTLTPAGAGKVRLGTHSAVGAETVTGFITVKDSGGTMRKLAVLS